MVLIAALLLGCVEERGPEDAWSWYDPGSHLDVEEPVLFTDVNYDFPADPSMGIGAKGGQVFPLPNFVIGLGPDDQFPPGSTCQGVLEPGLPFEIEGVITIHPRFYLKSRGCDGNSEEKYYGSFFLQDATGGLFALGDSRHAQFDVGNKVRIRVRGARTSFQMDTIYAWDLLEIDRTVHPIYYEWAHDPLGFGDMGLVRRVEGVVVTEKDTFGEFQIQTDEGVRHTAQIDMELNRRGLSYDLGERLQITGPVLYAYETFSIVIMRKGQVTVLDP